MTVCILGCGYTGKLVAQKLLAEDVHVICTSRTPQSLSELKGAEIVPLDVSAPFSLEFVPRDSIVVHSIPPIENIPQALQERPKRVIYLSTTGVYGAQTVVDENSIPTPRHERDWQRVHAEEAVGRGPWSSLVLRPAAIYGPGRGIQVSMGEGRFRLVDEGANYVSRIHVEDLAAHIFAALESPVQGAWPVADELPCTSVEIARFCSELLHVPMPDSVNGDQVHRTRRADRRVNGGAIRALLGIALRYPSYREGIPASLKKV